MTTKTINTIIASILVVFFIYANPNKSYSSTACNGNVDTLFINSDGSVLIHGSYRGEYTQICNMTQSWNGVDPLTCVSWLSIVKTALSQNKAIMVYYLTLDSCLTIPIYDASPAPGYIMMLP